NLEPLSVLARQQAVSLLVVDELLRLSVEYQRAANEVRDVAEMRQRRRDVTLEHVAREQLRIAGTDRIDEVLVVRVLGRREARRLAVRIGSIRAWSHLVLGSEVGLPFAPGFLDPQPPLRAVEEVADPYAPFVVREPAARPELEDLAVGV